MMHRVYGRKLGRNKDSRRRLFRDLYRAIIQYGRIRTTLAKAKAIQPDVDKLITKAKKSTTGSLGVITKTLNDFVAYTKLLDMAKNRFGSRSSGYTRIVKLGTRSGDASEMVYLEFVDAAPVKAETVKGDAKSKKAVAEPKSEEKVQEAEIVVEKPKKAPKKSKTVK